MKITGYRSLTTVCEWKRPIGDVNGVIESGITEVPVLILETDVGVEGIGLGGHADIDRIFPALEGNDPRAVTSLYDSMQAHVFKSGHCGSVFGAIGAADMALWDIKGKLAGEPVWRLLGAADRHEHDGGAAADARGELGGGEVLEEDGRRPVRAREARYREEQHPRARAPRDP